MLSGFFTSLGGKDLLKSILSRKMLVCGIMGFSCGLPLLLTMTLLQAWMKDEGLELSSLGLVTLLGAPYTFKFLWAPILDRYTPPFLGRRKGWMFISQLLLAGAIFALGTSSPSATPWLCGLIALMVSFFSATQDIVVDAYRREDLDDCELGLGSTLYIYGYRLGTLLVSGGGLILADHIPFGQVYQIMAACMLAGIITTLLTPEPKAAPGRPTSLRQAVVEPFKEYFSRNSTLWALGVLAFILLYKLGDTMASAMTIPFYLELGFTKTDIGAVVKLFGFWATIAGSFIGGVGIVRLGINRSLWVFGFLQAASTAGFAALAMIGPSITALSAVIAFENLSAGMGTAAFMAFMAALTDKRFTATQYALLSSLMGIPRVLLSAPTGFIAQWLGWTEFFLLCTFIAIPAFLLLAWFAPWSDNKPK